MWNPLVILVLCLCSFTYAVPLGLKKNMAIVQQEEEEPMLMLAADEETRPEVMISRLNLPSNATSIRADITDGFSCDNKTYGYYADVENECQIFHVCLPVTYADGKENTFRWSFICPEETVFSQDSFTCMRPEDMAIDCEESFKYYELNRNFGVVESENGALSAEDEMNMEETSRQDLEEDNNSNVIVAPVKKQTVKVQNSNRRKTQANRITIEAQRKKVQPLRKTPQPAAPVVTTAKPFEEEAPIFEQEAERTTVKYQRFTKRPSTPIKEQPKPEASKPEQQFVRQELFTQKRKRPQIFSATRLDAAVQTDSEPETEGSQKTAVLLQPQTETISQDQAEAQASEIAEVSIKPQVEKIAEPEPIETEKSESLAANEEKPSLPSDLKSEIAPMPENTPSRVEIVEIPIQRVDEPLIVQAPAILAPTAEEPKPVVEVIQPMKVEEEKIFNEELLGEEAMQAELTKTMEAFQQQEAEKSALEVPAEPEKPVEAEKVLFEPLPEADRIQEANEPEKLMELVKLAELPAEPAVQAPEPVKAVETVVQPEVLEMPAAEPETPLNEEKLIAVPEMPSEAEFKPEPLRIEAEPELEKPNEEEKPLRIEVSAPVPIAETVAEPEKPLEAEVPAVEAVLKVEAPIAEPEKPLETEISSTVPETPLRIEEPVPELPLIVDLPVPALEVPAKVEAPVEPEPAKPLEAERPTANLEIIKTALPMETAEKPAEADLSLESEVPPEAVQSEAQVEKSSEVQAEGEASLSAEQMEAQPQASGEIDSYPSGPEDAQALILDFISSLVNSENSNLEQQAPPMDELQSESIPEPAVSETKLAEEKPVGAEPPKPMYIPMMQDNDQMYQIPVQVIESEEPELPMPAPAVTEPKLPLSVDDVVELVKESLDTPAEKENIVQQPSASQPESPPDSYEVRPIYHRYFELGSNLLKSEALTASDEEEPKIIPAANDDSTAQEEAQQAANTMEIPSPPELPKTTEPLAEPQQLASEPESSLNSLPQALSAEPLPSEPASEPSAADRLAMSRSMIRFRMDPRKRRFLFRSDAS